jgi:protoporphyrinogen oxidase
MYPGLGWGINKIRFGLVGLYLRFTKNWKPLEKTTTDAWMRKFAGNKVFESMWKPMLDGKFGEHWADKVNMAWMWARLHVRTTRLGTFKGGFQRFADKFAEKLVNDGVDIRYTQAVKKISKNTNGGLDVLVGEAQVERFDRFW